ADGRQVGRAVQSLGPPVVYLQDSEVRVPPQGGEACEPAFGEQACEILPESEVGSTEADAKERSGPLILRVPPVLCRRADEDCEAGELGHAEQPISAGGVHVSRGEELGEPLEGLNHIAGQSPSRPLSNWLGSSSPGHESRDNW